MIRRIHPLWVWGVMFLSFLLVFGGLSTWFTIYFVTSTIHHECQALTLLTQTPVPKPPHPAVNPSREQNYRFYVALLEWRQGDRCP